MEGKEDSSDMKMDEGRERLEAVRD